MNTPTFQFVAGLALGLAALPVLAFLVRALAVEVQESESVLVTRFGRHVATLDTSGWHWLPARVLPWVTLRRVSLRRDFREIENIHVNDARGTSVIVDLWLELRITDPAKTAFAVVDWDKQLHDLVVHAAGAILGNRDFTQILGDRSELGERLREDLAVETARWGVELEQVYIRNVSLLPEISRQVLDSIAARLERAKADVEEEGRQAVALLEAETSAQLAKLVGDAKGQYPAAVGRVLARLKDNPEVLAAYNRLYELSCVRPHRTVSFSGFEPGELRAVDAAMLTPPAGEGASSLPVATIEGRGRVTG